MDGETNFIPLKSNIVLILQENELSDDIINTTQEKLVQLPASTNATTLESFNKKDIKEKRIILDAVKDHVIPHMTGKDRAYQMWDALTNLYQSFKENWKMVLREKMKSIKITKSESVASYLTRQHR